MRSSEDNPLTQIPILPHDFLIQLSVVDFIVGIVPVNYALMFGSYHLTSQSENEWTCYFFSPLPLEADILTIFHSYFLHQRRKAAS